jgi:hypothetical protein
VTISDEKKTPTDGHTNDETPLLSPAGRDFLDGKLDAEVYVGRARDIATEKARRELNITIDKEDQRGHRRIGLAGGAVATIAYALLGVYSFAFKTGSAVAIGASATAFVGVLVTLRYSQQDFHLLQRISDFLDRKTSHDETLETDRW